jgi:drug/metabolite transporter (DMT)-like permease
VPPRRVAALTSLAMLAFAGNSLLCRVALQHGTMDAASFTTIRLVSGAAVLWLIVRLTASDRSGRGQWLSALALFVYAAGFSFAYVTLPASTGALLLFGAVQATMIGHGIANGERLRTGQLCGLVLAVAGLVALLTPGLTAPPLAGAVLMLLAGVAWGVYSLRGRGGGDPTRVTAGNFLLAVPFALLLGLLLRDQAVTSPLGIWCAIASGVFASGVGYSIWYTALPSLTATSAATVQLSVPVITALGGIAFLDEPLTPRLVLASAAILGGIALVTTGSGARSPDASRVARRNP